jgi:hypothetical protein
MAAVAHFLGLLLIEADLGGLTVQFSFLPIGKIFGLIYDHLIFILSWNKSYLNMM